jgi:diadenosine tetraphosphate (Ap4A) HIT family hydrolase
MSDEFRLHPRLEADTSMVTDWVLSRVLLAHDARFCWIILVPRRAAISELHELTSEDRLVLVEEIARAGAGLKTIAAATKINVGALGNHVPQLHVHVVARHPGDAAWPGPVWGHGQPAPYDPIVWERLLVRLRSAL